jgi:quercetin dioxygenase-like cupin family protein
MKAALFVVAALFFAPAIPEVEITAEPHHHLVLENKYVRVFNVDVPPHNDTLMHWHRHDYAYIIVGAAHVSNEVKGKSPAEIKLADGYAGFSPATFAHIAKNLSDQPFRNIAVEYLQDETLRKNEKANTAKLDATRGLDILHGGTAEILFVNDAVRATNFELQPGGMVPTHHHQGPHLLIAVTDLNLREDGRLGKMNDKGYVIGHLDAGASKWLPANISHTITNTGDNPAKFITLEFP